jgi:two-component system LytT family response regulator
MITTKIVPYNDYLALKMEVDRLRIIVSDLTARIGKSRVSQHTEPTEDSIMVHIKGISRYIKKEDIIMIKAESNYSILYLVGGESVFTSKTLKYWQEKCQVPYLQRVHKSYLINVRCITSYVPKTGEVLLQGGLKAHYTANINRLLQDHKTTMDV